MKDLIDRQAAIDTILSLTNCSTVRELYEYIQEHQLTNFWTGGINDAIDAVIGVPSAQPEILACGEGELNVPDTNVEDMISRQAAIDTEGLDAEIRCEMCKNPMRTDRGCDGHCEYDEKLYEKIMQILDERIKQLPSAQPEIIRCKDCKHWRDSDGVYRRGIDAESKCPLNIQEVYAGTFYCGYAERRTDE